jgi:hypothetical protein
MPHTTDSYKIFENGNICRIKNKNYVLGIREPLTGRNDTRMHNLVEGILINK